jgi:hypothetical protein
MSAAPEVWVMEVVQEHPTGDKLAHMVDIMAGEVTTRYLLGFWPDRYGGRGEVTFTDDIAKARRFPGFAEVMECWQTPSKVRPLRPDGMPNRPLTAYTITPKRVRR